VVNKQWMLGRRWLDYDALLQAACLDGNLGIRPQSSQSITQLASILLRGLGRESDSLTGSLQSIIVIAIDGVNYDVAAEAWSRWPPDLLLPLSTTFPSTSSTAWLSAVTAQPVEQHLVVGVCYRLPATGTVIDCYADGPWGAVGRDRPAATVFDRLSARGVACVCVPGEVATWGPAWLDALCHGARVLPSDAHWSGLRLDPVRLTRIVLSETAAAAEGAGGQARLTWCWVDLDDAVHRHGYSEDVLTSLGEVARAAATWRDRGHTVITVSDHGLVPVRSTPEAVRGWEAANSPALCRLPPGGSGRVRWCYPRRGRAGQVVTRLTDAIGDGLILERDQLADMGLLRMTRAMRARIGEVVALATGPRFPPPDPAYRFEHGSVTPAEMVVPLGVWQADSGTRCEQ
jgi:Type I phosphodiesterase / nucleotide pyrophosphatase